MAFDGEAVHTRMGTYLNVFLVRRCVWTQASKQALGTLVILCWAGMLKGP